MEKGLFLGRHLIKAITDRHRIGCYPDCQVKKILWFLCTSASSLQMCVPFYGDGSHFANSAPLTGNQPMQPSCTTTLIIMFNIYIFFRKLIFTLVRLCAVELFEVMTEP